MTKRLRLEWLAALWVGFMPVALLAAWLASSSAAVSTPSATIASSTASPTPPADLDPAARLPEARLVDAGARAVTRPLLDGTTPLSSWLSPSSWTLTPPPVVTSSSVRAVGRPAARHGLARWRVRGLPARAGPVSA